MYKKAMLITVISGILLSWGMSVFAKECEPGETRRQVCTAVHGGQSYSAKSQKYQCGESLGDYARKEACMKAELKCRKDNPTASNEGCFCDPRSYKDGGSCERL